MPKFSLSSGSALDPLAPFKVLAVMCHPTDRARREAMTATITKQSGIGNMRRAPLDDDKFMAEVGKVSRRAGLVGTLLLTRLQLFEHGQQWSLNEAIPLVKPWLPKWEHPFGADPAEAVDRHTPTSRPKILDINRRFVSVAHLWAALVHGEQHGDREIWPGRNSTLPNFLAHAECFLQKSERLPTRGSMRSTHPTRPSAWTFLIPEQMRFSVELQAWSLDEIRNAPTTRARPITT